MSTKVTLEIEYSNRVGGGSSTRLKIFFWPKSLSDKAIKYFWMKTGYAKSGTFQFDENGNRIYDGADHDA